MTQPDQAAVELLGQRVRVPLTFAVAAGDQLTAVLRPEGLTLREDAVHEPDEDFFVYVYDLSGASVGDAVARITLVDNDAPAGTPRVSIPALALDEADRAARFVVRLDRPSDAPLAIAAVAGAAALVAPDGRPARSSRRLRMAT